MGKMTNAPHKQPQKIALFWPCKLQWIVLYFILIRKKNTLKFIFLPYPPAAGTHKCLLMKLRRTMCSGTISPKHWKMIKLNAYERHSFFFFYLVLKSLDYGNILTLLYLFNLGWNFLHFICLINVWSWWKPNSFDYFNNSNNNQTLVVCTFHFLLSISLDYYPKKSAKPTEKTIFFSVLRTGNNDCLETFETRVNFE